MAAQLQITMRDMPHSEALEARIRRNMARLERVHDRITACRVTVEASHHHHRQGILYSVKLELALPGVEIMVTRDHDEDVYGALRDAFQAARRQLIERGKGAARGARRPERRSGTAAGVSRDE